MSSPATYGQRLTPHEIEILTAVAHGHADKQIGTRLHIAESTVKTHVRRMFIKLGAINRANLVALGFTNGYLRLTTKSLNRVGGVR